MFRCSFLLLFILPVLVRANEPVKPQLEAQPAVLEKPPTLRVMKEQGLIQARWRTSESGRQRKYYALKRDGKAALDDQKQQWLLVHQTLAKLWG
jgi:hypothetical protein